MKLGRMGAAGITACMIACSAAPIEYASPVPAVPDKAHVSGGDAGGLADAAPVQRPGMDESADWAFVYARYFAVGTPGHCGTSGCHAEIRSGFKCGATKDTCYEGLIAAGLLDLADPAASRLGDAQKSPLAWYGTDADGNPTMGRVDGKMPYDNPVANTDAADAVTKWLAVGAKNAGWSAKSNDAGTDAGTYGETDAAVDAPFDAAPDTGAADAHVPDAAGPGPTWTALYTTYFGAGTPGHCGNSGCHSVTRMGFKCGSSKASCYSGLVAAGLVDTANPSQSTLGNPNTSPLAWFGGAMPKDNAVANAAAAQAVTAWLNAGAPNN